MKATPNLDFTAIEPTKPSLVSFVAMIRKIYQNLTDVINGKLGFGDGTNRDNIDGTWINVVAPVAPNTDFTVNHNLGRIPVGYWIMIKDRAVDVYTGSIAATNTALTLRATVASAVIRLFVVGLFLGLFVPRSEAQGANHTNIALGSVKLPGNLGVSNPVAQPIPNAIITVCNGTTLPSPGTVCLGTSLIYSNAALTSVLSNPTNADAFGNYTFYANAGFQYVVSVSGTGFTTYSYVWSAPILSSSNLVLTGSVSISPPGSFSSTATSNINNTLYISSFPGADLGAQMRAAVTNCTVTLGLFGCKYIFDVGGTVSTSPNFPVGSIIECTAPTPITFTAPWLFSHHGVIVHQNGCIIKTSVTGPAIDIGKLAATAAVAGTVNTSGTSVTLVSGQSFLDIDKGDYLIVQGAGTFQIASINSGTSITTIGTVGTFTGAQYTVQMSPENPVSGNPTNTPIVITDGFLQFVGGSGEAIRATAAGNLDLDVKTFGGYSTGVHLRGTISSNIKLLSSGHNPFLVEDFTFGGFTSGSNNNRLAGDWSGAPNSTGACVDIKNSGANKFVKGSWRLESNNCRQGIFLEGTTSATVIDGGYVERTGDGTSTSNNILVSIGVTGTVISRNLFTDFGTAFNNGGNAIAIQGPTNTGTKISENFFNGNSSSYSSAIHSLGGGTANLDSNTYQGTYSGGAVVGFPGGGYLFDIAGNISTTGAITSENGGAPTGTGVLVRATSPTLITPNLGAATATSLTINGVPVAGSGFTGINVTPTTVNTNTSSDQNGMAITITAGSLNLVSRTLLIQLAGVYSTPAASTTTITHKLKLCTVSGCGSGTVITLASWTTSALGGIQATNNPYNCVTNASTQTAGATAAFESHGNLTIDLAALASAAESVFADNNTATVGTIDSTAQLFLQHTIAFGTASSSNSATDRQMIADTVD